MKILNRTKVKDVSHLVEMHRGIKIFLHRGILPRQIISYPKDFLLNLRVIIINDFRRAAVNRGYIAVSLGITFAMILLAIFFTSRFEVKGNIALVTNSDSFTIQTKYFHVTRLAEEPPESQLVSNKYDAVVVDEGNGQYRIETIKNAEFAENLRQMLRNPDAYEPAAADGKKAGSSILGYLILFLLMQGLFFMTYFTQDKESGNFKRIVTSPVSAGSYFTAHVLFNVFMIAAPTMIVLAVCRELLRVDIGFSYLQYAGLVTVLALFSSIFALFISALIEKSDNVMTGAGTIVVLTSILSGSFGAMKTGSGTFNDVLKLLPQNSYLMLARGIEAGKGLSYYLPYSGYLLFLMALMAGMGAMVCTGRLKEGKY